jgi:hypothetical protein
MTFDQWFAKLIEIAQTTCIEDYSDYVQADKSAWLDYYEWDYSPREAFLEDLSYAD